MLAIEKKLKVISKPPSQEKELKAIENRVNVKLTNAIEKMGDVNMIIDKLCFIDNEKIRK